MIENIDKIKQNRETNISAVKEQKRIVEIEIQVKPQDNWSHWSSQEKMFTCQLFSQE
jgi:hypothetical protein